MAENHNNTKSLTNIYVNFIDLLFAVVIAQSFFLFRTNYSDYFTNPSQNAFGIATMILVYVLVISSWIGYHRSLELYPMKNPIRFVVDLWLLFLYYMAFASASSFFTILEIFVLVFASYVIWDAFRVVEYFPKKRVDKEPLKRLGISAIFLIFFIVVYCLYPFFENIINDGINWGFFVAIFVLLISYRSCKWYRKKS